MERERAKAVQEGGFRGGRRAPLIICWLQKAENPWYISRGAVRLWRAHRSSDVFANVKLVGPPECQAAREFIGAARLPQTPSSTAIRDPKMGDEEAWARRHGSEAMDKMIIARKVVNRVLRLYV